MTSPARPLLRLLLLLRMVAAVPAVGGAAAGIGPAARPSSRRLLGLLVDG